MVGPDGRRAARSNPNPSRTPNPNPDPSPDPNPNQVDAPFVDECTYIDRTSPPSAKEKVVVLGSGWAAVKFALNIDTSRYEVTVISPRNFFLFTPFLPSW